MKGGKRVKYPDYAVNLQKENELLDKLFEATEDTESRLAEERGQDG